MAGFEVVVRPAIFPNIRPRPKPSLPPEDDPTKGFAVIQGNPAKAIGMSFSQSISSSHSRPVEMERRVDEVRVYQKEDNGTINRENFVDMQVANRITMTEPGQDDGAKADPDAHVDVGASVTKTSFFQEAEETENIEIKEHNKIIKNKKAPP